MCVCVCLSVCVDLKHHTPTSFQVQISSDADIEGIAVAGFLVIMSELDCIATPLGTISDDILFFLFAPAPYTQ